MFSKDFRKKGTVGLRLTSPVTEREISSISRVMVLSKRVCHTRSTTVPLDVFSTLPREPSVSSSTRRLVDVSSQNASMSALNTSSTPNLVKVSSTVLLLTTLPSRTPRPLAPTSMSRESISNHMKLIPSNSSEKSQKLLLQSHTNSLSKLGSNKMGLHNIVLCFTAVYLLL